MPYEATCPKGHRLQVTEAHFGERVMCPTCGEPFVVPDASSKIPGSGSLPQSSGKAGLDYRRWKASFEAFSGLARPSLLAGRPMVAVGLLLVLLARGCDSVSRRGVDRADMKAKVAREQFDDEWQKTRLDLEEKLAALEDNKDSRSQDFKAIADLKTQLSDVAGRQAKARKLAESGTWRALDANTRAAKASQQIDGYWREIFFVFASMVLATGLLMVSWSAEGAERWISLVLLAIITNSVFIGGTAWIPMGH